MTCLFNDRRTLIDLLFEDYVLILEYYRKDSILKEIKHQIDREKTKAEKQIEQLVRIYIL